MAINEYMPRGLPLLTDNVLVRTLIDYRHAYELLLRSTSEYTTAMRDQFEDAMRAIENELRVRGLTQYTF